MQNQVYSSIYKFALFFVISIFVSGPIKAHEYIYLRSPIDGFVTEVSKKGQIIEAGTSAQPWLNLANPDLSSCNSSPLNLDFSTDASFARFSDRNQVGDVPVAAAVFSPLIEKEISAASARYTLAEQKLELITGEIEYARQANAEELAFVGVRQTVEGRYSAAQLAVAAQTPDNVDQMPAPVAGQLGLELKDMREKEMAVISKAQNRFVEHDLQILKASAEQDVSAAGCELDILIATKGLGQVFCPVKCEVTEIHVLPGQWITKGDPLLSIRPVD